MTSWSPLLLAQASTDFLNTVTRQAPGRRARFEELLGALDRYLGSPAPLLAYTRLTGETWWRSLPEADREDAAELLASFRAHLRDGGWLDAARPVNVPD